MQHFWKQVGKVRWTIVLGLTMAILKAACDLFWPTIIATIVDDGIVPPTIDIKFSYPGIAAQYAKKPLSPYIPPTF